MDVRIKIIFLQIRNYLRETILLENTAALQSMFMANNFNMFLPIDMNGLSLLHYAVQQEKIKVVEFLCICMKDVDIRDFVIFILFNYIQLGRTPLHYAVSKSNKNIVKTLLAAGADVNAMTIGGDTPLSKAISHNQNQSVKLLLRFGANQNIFHMVLNYLF